MLEDPRTDPVSFANVMVGLDKAGISDDARLEMYKQRRFGIDWGVGASVSTAASPEDDWETSMDNMYDLCRDGGLVFIPATNTPKIEGGLLGQVPAHSDIELRDYEARKASGEKTMKTHQLRRVREVHPNDGTGVFAEVNWGQYTVHGLDTHRDKIVDAYKQLY
jgi:hypothetical protein